MGRWMIAAVLAALCVPAWSADRPEYRGFWAEGFNKGIHTPEEIDTMLARLREANCNAVWPQFRKRGDAHYASTYEIWAREDSQHFDALQYMLDKAHGAEPKIEVHAWLNTCAVGGETRGGHILIEHPEYTSISDEGVAYDNEAMKIDPGHPGANDWTFRVYLDVVRHYDVDGVHFDFVRYGNPHWGFNRASVALFNQQHGRVGKPAWDDPDFQQWRRDAVTALVRKVYAHTKAVKPDVAVYAATIAWGNGPKTYDEYTKSAPYSRVYQDWVGWMQEGILDINCPMFYFSNTRHREFWLNWTAWAKDHVYDRQLVLGQGIWLNTIPDTFQQIEDSRAATPAGNRPDGILLYSYAGTNRDEKGAEAQYNPEFYRALSQPGPHGSQPFQEAVRPPAPRDYPAGIVKGFALTDPYLAPVVGARVQLSDGALTREMTTDVTGFYAFVGLPRGRYSVTVTAPHMRPVTHSAELVSRTSVVTAHAFMSGGSAKGELISSPMLVTGGDNVFRDVIYVWDPVAMKGRKVKVRPDYPLPFQAGDVVAVADLPGGLPPAIRLVDIDSGFDARFATGFRSPNSISELARKDHTTGKPVRLAGTVEKIVPSGFMLKDASGSVLVSGASWKQAPSFDLTQGQDVTVTGVVDKEDGFCVSLLNLSPGQSGGRVR